MAAEQRGPPPLATLPASAFRADVLVRFSHCDPAGIVYFARYFDILNGVIEDWFSAALGLSYAAFVGPRRIGLGCAGVAADFLAPGFMGDRLTFVPLVERIGRASVPLAIHGYRGDAPLLSARMTIVTTSLVEHRAIPVPDDLRHALETYRNGCR